MITENEFPGRDSNTPSREPSERDREGLPGGSHLSTDEAEERNASSDEDTDDLDTEAADTEEDDELALDEEDLEENNLSDEEADDSDLEPRR